MDSYIMKGKLHGDVQFCSILKHLKLTNFTLSALPKTWHQPVQNIISKHFPNSICKFAYQEPLLIGNSIWTWSRHHVINAVVVQNVYGRNFSYNSSNQFYPTTALMAWCLDQLPNEFFKQIGLLLCKRNMKSAWKKCFIWIPKLSPLYWSSN